MVAGGTFVVHCRAVSLEDGVAAVNDCIQHSCPCFSEYLARGREKKVGETMAPLPPQLCDLRPGPVLSVARFSHHTGTLLSSSPVPAHTGSEQPHDTGM